MELVRERGGRSQGCVVWPSCPAAPYGCASDSCGRQLAGSGVLVRQRIRWGFRGTCGRQLLHSGVLLRHLIRLGSGRARSSCGMFLSRGCWPCGRGLPSQDASSEVLQKVRLRPVKMYGLRPGGLRSVVPDVCMSSSCLRRVSCFRRGLLRCPVGCGRRQRVMWSLWDIMGQHWHSQCLTHSRQCPLRMRRRWMSRGTRWRRHCCSRPCLWA